MSRRNIILLAAPFIAVVVLVPLLKGLGASQEIVWMAMAVNAVVCGGALGAFMDPVPELPRRRRHDRAPRSRASKR